MLSGLPHLCWKTHGFVFLGLSRDMPEPKVSHTQHSKTQIKLNGELRLERQSHLRKTDATQWQFGTTQIIYSNF